MPAFVHFLLCFIVIHTATAQQTLVQSDPWRLYQSGLESWNQKNFTAARKAFEQALQQPFSHAAQPEVLLQNLHFYLAACAVENNDKDARMLIHRYLLHFHETDKRKWMYFYAGKLYFQEKKYSDAIESLAKLQEEDLLPELLNEYRFMLGYSYFTKKKFNEAKPLFKSLIHIEDKYFYPANYYYAFICFYTNDFDESLKSFLKIQDSKMYAGVIPYYIAQIYYAQREYRKVIDYIPTKVNDNGVMYKAELNFLMGQAYFQLSEYQKALPLLDDYLSKQNKANKFELYQLAYSQYKTGDYRRAIENFIQLNLLNDTLGQHATYALADCYLKTHQKEKAITAFQSASNMAFNTEIRQISLFHYGKLLVETASYGEAVKVLQNYIEQNPGSDYYAEASELLATALFQTKNYESAYQLMEKMTWKNPKLNETYQKITYFRAVQLLNDGKPNEAGALCEKSLTYPIDKNIAARAWYLMAESQYQQQQYADAAINFAKSLHIGATYDPSFSPFLVFYNVGYAHFKQKQYKQAASAFEKAIQEANTFNSAKVERLLPDAYLRFADCSFVTKEYEDALQAYTKIESSGWPNAEYALFQKAILYGLKNKNTEKITTLETLLRRFPGSRFNDHAYFEIGETYLEDGNFDAAQKTFENLLTKFPTSVLIPKVYLKIALVTYNKNKKSEAFEAYKKTVNQFPKSTEAKEALMAMKEIAVEIGKTDEYVALASGFGNITASQKDSLSWQAAENAFNNNECDRALPLLSNYLQQFPSGYFVNEAYFARAECYWRSKNFSPAYNDYKKVIESKPSKWYERALLRASGIAYFEWKDFPEAFALYDKLLQVASTPAHAYTAQLGLLKTADKLKYDSKIIEYADLLLQNNQLKESDAIEINYLKGKALYRLKEYETALPILNKVGAAAMSEKAAECKYYVCRILFEKQQYKASLDSCIKLKNKFAAYEYWVVKTFILMADNYVSLDNSFQAKATLESIVTYYDGDAELKREAAEKLEALRSEEIQKSKLMRNPFTTDSLMMENPADIK